jgi:Ice-binding-like
VFILQAGSTLITAAGSRIALEDGAQACNVFWQVGSSATLGASSLFNGTILASTSISMGDSVTVAGRALARDGAVTMINDTVATAPCTTAVSDAAPGLTTSARNRPDGSRR